MYFEKTELKKSQGVGTRCRAFSCLGAARGKTSICCNNYTVISLSDFNIDCMKFVRGTIISLWGSYEFGNALVDIFPSTVK